MRKAMNKAHMPSYFAVGILLSAITMVFLTKSPVRAALGNSAVANSITIDDGPDDFESPADFRTPGMGNPVYVGGAQHWAALMCKFSDVGAEPGSIPFFEEMFSRANGPSLEDFWREASYEHITDVTAEAFGWFTLPNNRAHYGFSETNAGFDIDAIIQDCVDVADATINFASFDAVSVMLNSPAPVAMATLFPLVYPDGATISLGALAIPSNKFNLALMAHEMGHAYGLPHSSANGQSYANPWDLMGIASAYRCGVNEDPLYSCLGQHPISKFKDDLGWLAPAQVYEAPTGTSTVTIERLAQPQTTNPLMVRVAAGSVFYTVEARMRVGYDAKLAGDAVIIHRNGTDLVDGDGAAPYDDDGAMWLPGETFHDEQNGVEIEVDSATPTGFTITVTTEDSSGPQPIKLISSSVSPPTAHAGDRVDFEWQLIYDDGFFGAAPATISVTLPAEMTYVPGSVQVEGPYTTQIESEDPLVVSVESFFLDTLTVRYAGTIDGAVTDTTWLTIPLLASWPEGSGQFESVLLVNGEETFLPVVTQQP